ncbi:MAG TPA: carboxypeptidase regulatory-like domain-containing protein [Acidobacteriaceae bacterium]|nr:carboxypeptidase regulatory-like domain-containing protein [Acidobacteriaceae bacterium]
MYSLSVATSLRLFPKAARKHGLREICLALLLFCFGITSSATAQTGGEGGIQGTVADSTGAAIPNATVTATNNATGVSEKRQTTSAGLYTISPIVPGTYTVTATAQGFDTVSQKNLTVNALVMTPLDITLTVGSTATEVTVTTEPPQLETTNATLGMTIENAAYSGLPLIMNGAQRDPTAFGTLAPGAQGGSRLPVIGGTGNYLGQLYLDGLPAETVSQQGDNRLVSQSISVDAVDQMQVVTSTPPAEYSGAGAENFTMKSGGLKFHGSVQDFIRNTALDAWQFSKGATKPVDHQNELSATIGGHVPGTRRVFFFFAYDRYHNRTFNNPVTTTIPTLQMRQGDFSQLNCLTITNASDRLACATAGGPSGLGGSFTYGGTTITNTPYLFDPTNNNCGGTDVRCAFEGAKNGVATYNVIPQSYLSPFALKAEQWLPTPTNSDVVNNYTAGQAGGFDNHLYDWRVDFDVSPKHRISTIGAMGTVNYLNNFNTPYLPLPYTGGDLANIYPKDFDVEDAYTITNSLVNQLKFGYVRFYQNIHNTTQNSSTYGIGALGVTNLPAGQAGTEFPGATFSATTKFGTVQQYWTGTTSGPSGSVATQITTPNNYALVDNLQWVKGAHSLTFGGVLQWQEINNANPSTYTGVLSLTYNGNDTAQYVGSSLSTTATGYSYASFLLGAVGGTPSLGLQPVSEEGGRYFTIAPYAEDTWKVNSKLTVDAGVRWDYLPPYHEVKDRWSFMNPTLTNPATGTPGAIQFAGNYGGAGASCGCRTPVQTYWKNWGPRIGITYQTDQKTVFRAGVGRVFSQAGGVGGRGGAFNGTGQLGFNVTATGPAEVTTGAGAAPSFYLNNSAYFTSLGINNTDLFGKGYAYPTPPAPGAATESLNAGHYVDSSGVKHFTAQSVSYADPYFSSRAPDFMFYNAGVERAITNNMTLAINYVGNESHHLINSTNTGTGTARGYWSNQLDPRYLVGLGAATDTTGKLPLLTAPANTGNVQKAQGLMSGINIPGFFTNAANLGDTTATIAQGLIAFPQYSGVSDTWGNVGNFSYNSLQVTVQQRLAHGLTFNFNYTWARNVGDDGPYRTGFNLPSGSVSGTSQSYRMNRIDRSETTVSTPNVIHAFGVWDLPFGRNHIGGNNWAVRTLAGGWSLGDVFTYASGTPVQITYGGCTTPLQGQCMPDLNPSFSGSARQNGGYGDGPNGRTAANLAKVVYINPTAFKTPTNINQTAGVTLLNLIGNAPRTGALDLRNPIQWNMDANLRRSIPLVRERLALVIEVDSFNVFNHTLFSNPNAVFNSATFGQISSASNKPRSFELAGHITF